MSIRAIDWAFDQKTGSAASKLVLIKLADNANDKGFCYPSLEYISAHCEMHRSTVIKHIKKLADAGFLLIEHRFVDGAQVSNIYHLKMLPVVAETDGGGRPTRRGGSPNATGVVAQRDGGGSPNATLNLKSLEPCIEPVIEPKDTSASKSAPPGYFDAFWSAYPRKKNRAAAIKAFRRIKPELLPTLFADIEARIRVGDWRLDQPEFIPHPATYLNGERWTDVITPRSKNDETSRQLDRPRSPGERFAALRAAQQAAARGDGQTLDGDAEYFRPSVREQFRAPAVGRLGNDFGRDNPEDDRIRYRADEDD